MEISNPTQIENMIYVVRGQKVMLDSDLAELYEIPTSRMNEQVKRNLDRFPPDFMFQLTDEEYADLLNLIEFKHEGRGGRRKLPFVFTECGVAMLSSVLSSPRAISVNISIMRTFVRLRSFLSMETTPADKVDRLEKDTAELFKGVFTRLDNLEGGLPSLSKHRKKIGLSIRKD
jgi:hypothetical protein